jgi:hypothetical protein
MPSQTDPYFSPADHHYPSSSAKWVTSLLGHEDDGLTAPSQPAVSSLLRAGAGATLIGGLLAIAGSFLQYIQVTHPMFWFLWLVVLTVFLAMGTALGSITLLQRVTPRITRQVIAFAFLCAAAQVALYVAFAVMAASAILLQGAGIWLSVAGILLLLGGGSLLRSIGQTTLSSQELADQASKESRTGEYTRGDKFLGGWRRNWNPPQTGN